MAQYEHLPIFRTSFRLTVYLEEAVRKMPRYHKYAIGSRIHRPRERRAPARHRATLERGVPRPDRYQFSVIPQAGDPGSCEGWWPEAVDSGGSRLRDRCARVIRAIIRANNTRIGTGPSGAAARVRVLEELRLEIEALKTDIQLAKELKAFASFDDFRVASGLAVDLGRQGEGWLRATRPDAGPNRASRTG